jgi:hypothetical protein
MTRTPSFASEANKPASYALFGGRIVFYDAKGEAWDAPDLRIWLAELGIERDDLT